MTRTLTAGMQTEVAALLGEFVHFVEFQLSGGTLRYNTGTTDISWNGFTWTAIGGQIVVGQVEETADVATPGCEVTLSGVDLTLLAAILSQQYIGRTCKAYIGHVDLTTRAIVADPVPIFLGLMNGGWSGSEQRTPDGGGTATITGRLTNRLAVMQERHGIQCNIMSHAGFYPDELFFRGTQDLASREKVLDWGKK